LAGLEFHADYCIADEAEDLTDGGAVIRQIFGLGAHVEDGLFSQFKSPSMEAMVAAKGRAVECTANLLR